MKKTALLLLAMAIPLVIAGAEAGTLKQPYKGSQAAEGLPYQYRLVQRLLEEERRIDQLFLP